MDGTHRNEIGDAQFVFRLALFESHICLSAEVGVHIKYYSLCSTMYIVRIPTVLLYIVYYENIRCSFRCASLVGMYVRNRQFDSACTFGFRFPCGGGESFHEDANTRDIISAAKECI